RLRDEDEVFPDILLIDGGKGQLNAALAAFENIGIAPPCLISLAKQEEEIFRPGEAESIRLSKHSAALRLLQYVRDEAHRFAQHYHHLLRRKKLQEEGCFAIPAVASAHADGKCTCIISSLQPFSRMLATTAVRIVAFLVSNARGIAGPCRPFA